MSFFQTVDIDGVIMTELIRILEFGDFQGDVVLIIVLVSELDEIGDFQVYFDDFKTFDFFGFSDVVFYKFLHGFEFFKVNLYASENKALEGHSRRNWNTGTR
ncbi:MAG: hypothetical protein D4R93_00340 [Deltaproteobacteria bacterium]|nr:MAG: hypothetical protein D4R93_00340 [Deltaproteobacteria bacterium]